MVSSVSQTNIITITPLPISTITDTTTSEIFRAQPRPHAEATLCDHLITVGKILLFPVTLLYYLIKYICSYIAFTIGIANSSSKTIDETKRNTLKNFGGEEILFQAEDGVTLEGMHFSAPNPDAKTILICSGSHKSYEEFVGPMVDAFLKMDHNVLVFNYRGFGRSEGNASEEGFYLDAEAAYQYIKQVKNQDDENIVAMGYSLGSAPATDLAAHHNIDLFLDRYFSSMKDVAYDAAKDHMGVTCVGGAIAKGIFYLGGADFDVKEKIKAVQGRIFLARGNRDRQMYTYHEELLQQTLQVDSTLRSREMPFVEQVDSGHIHSSNFDLWFHPENGYANNQLPKEHLRNFLN